MSDYEKLGVKRLINACATMTKYGGSLMPPEVLAAMTGAATAFVDMPSLQRHVGARIAQLTHNESVYVTSGAAAGLMLSAAACVMHRHPDACMAFPRIAELSHEAIIFKTQRNPYDFAVGQTGVTLVDIEPTAAALRAAISGKTAAVYWFAGALAEAGDITLPEVIGIANEKALPVVVDAAAQLPPVENLWRFTRMGASLALFSGGKDLRGPQSSGLMLGRADLIDLIRPISSPNHGLGRPLKVGKEEMLGALAAVERYLALDHAAREQFCEDCVALWQGALDGIAGLKAERAFPNEAGQPLAWCRISVDAAVLGKSAVDIEADLLDGDPAVVIYPADQSHFYLNPMTLQPGEELTVRDALLKALGTKHEQTL